MSKEIFSGEHRHSLGESSKGEGAAITGKVDGKLVDQGQDQRLRVCSLRRKTQKTSKGIILRERSHPLATTSKRERATITEIDDDACAMTYDDPLSPRKPCPVHGKSENTRISPNDRQHHKETIGQGSEMSQTKRQHPHSPRSSRKSGQVHLRSGNKQTLPDEHQQPQKEISNQVAAMAQNVDEQMVLDQTEGQFLSSRNSGQVNIRSKNEEALQGEHQQTQAETSNQIAAIAQNVDEQMVLDHTEGQFLSSRNSGQVNITSENEEAFQGEHQQTQAETSNQILEMTENVEGGMVVDRNEHQLVSSRKCEQVHLKSENKESLPSEQQQLQAETNSQAAATTENVVEGMGVEHNEGQFLSSNKSSLVHLRSVSKDSLPDGHQPSQAKTSTQTPEMTENVEGGMVVDPNEDQLTSSNKSEQGHFKSENKESLPSEQQQPQADSNSQVAATTENVDDGMVVDQLEDQFLSSSKSSLVHLRSENRTTLPDEHEQLQAKTSNQIVAIAVNGDEGMVVDQSHFLSSNKSEKGHLKSENKEGLPSEHHQPHAQTVIQAATTTEYGNGGMVVDQGVYSSVQVHFVSDSKETLPGKQQQPQVETVREGAGVTEDVDEGAQRQGPPHSSKKSDEVYLQGESKEPLTNKHQQPHVETSVQSAEMIEKVDGMLVDENQDIGQTLFPGKLRENHLSSVNKETLSSEQKQTQAASSTEGADMKENVDGMLVDECQDPHQILSSSEFSEHQLKTENSTEGDALIEDVQDGMVVDESQDPGLPLTSNKSVQVDLRSSSKESVEVKVQETQTETVPSQHQQPHAETSNQRAAMKEGVDEGMLVDQSQDELVSSSKVLRSENRATLPDERQRPHAKTSNQVAAITEHVDDGMVEEQSEGDAVSSCKSGKIQHLSESKEKFTSQGESSNQTAAITENIDDGMFVDVRKPPLSISNSELVHLTLENKETLLNEHQQPQAETSHQVAAMTEDVDGIMAGLQRQENVSLSKSDQVLRKCESNDVLPDKQQQLREEGDRGIAAVTENVDDGMVVDEIHSQAVSSHQALMTENANVKMAGDQCQDPLVSSSKSSQVVLKSESKASLLGEQQQSQAETSNQAAAITEHVDDGMVISEIHSADPPQTSSDHVHLKYESNETLRNGLELSQAESSHQAVLTEIVSVRMAEEHIQDPDLPLSSSKSFQVHVTSESKETLPGKQQQPPAEASREKGAITEHFYDGMDVDEVHPQAESSQQAAVTENVNDGMATGKIHVPVLPQSSSKPGHLHPQSDSKETLQNEHQQPEAGSGHQAGVTENVKDVMATGEIHVPDLPQSSSKSGHLHPKSDSKETLQNEHQQPQAESGHQAGVTENVNDGMATGEIHVLDLPQSSSKSGHLHTKSDSKETLQNEHQQPQAESGHQAAVTENVNDGMATGEIHVPDLPQSSSKSGHLHPKSDSKETLQNEHQQSQAESGHQAGVTENVNDGMATGEIHVPDLPQSSSKSGHLHPKSDSKETLQNEHQQPQAESGHQAGVTENVNDGMATGEIHVPDLPQSSSTSGHLHPKSDSKETLQNEHQQPQAESGHQAGVTENVNHGMATGKIHVPDLPQSSSKSGHLHPKSDSKETLQNEHQQPQAESGHQAGVTEIENCNFKVDLTMKVDVRMTGEHNQDPDLPLSSSESVQVHLTFENKETFPSQHQQLHAETRNQKAAVTENLDQGMVVDQNEGQCLSSNTSEQVPRKVESKDTLPGKEQQPQDETDREGAAVTENVEDRMVVDQSEDQVLCSSKSSQVFVMSECKDSLPGKQQQPQPESSKIHVLGPPQSTSKSDHLHPKSDSKENVPHEHQQLKAETSSQIAALTENVDEGMVVDQIEDQFLSSVKSEQVHITSVSETLPTHQQPQAMTSNHLVAMTENVDEAMVAAQKEAQFLSSNKSEQVSSTSESKETLPSEHRQPQAESSRQKAAITENVDEGMVVDQIDQFLSSNKSEQVHLTSESETLLSEHQPRAETSLNQIAAMKVVVTQNDPEGMIVDHSQGPDERLPSRKCSHVHLKIEAGEHQQMGVVTENDNGGVLGDERQEPDQTLPSRSSPEIHLKCDKNDTFSSEQPHAGTSSPEDEMTESVDYGIVVDHSQSPDRPLSSNKSVQVHLRTSSKEILQVKDEETQTESSRERAAMAEAFDDGMLVDQSQGQLVSTSRSGQARPFPDSRRTLLSEHHHSQAGASREGPPITDSVDGGMGGHFPDLTVSSSKSGQVHLKGEETFPRDHQQPQEGVSNQAALMTGNVDDGMVDGEGDVRDPPLVEAKKVLDKSRDQFGLTSTSWEVHLKCNSMETLPGKQQQPQAETSNQRAPTTENVDQGMVVDQQPMSSKSGQGHSLLSSKHQMSQHGVQRTMVVEGVDNTLLNGAMSTRSQAWNRASEMWKKIKFHSRRLQGHNGPVCGVDCRGSVLVSGG